MVTQEILSPYSLSDGVTTETFSITLLPSLFTKIGHLRRIGVGSVQTLLNSSYKMTMEVQILTSKAHTAAKAASPLLQTVHHDGNSEQNLRRHRIGDNVSKKDKIKFLITTLLDLNDSKDAVYGALDAWVAWEQNFPIASIKQVLIALEKEQQWHRIVQVIKWMLSKGQGTTMGTYAQLIRALDMDHRAKEAHEFWLKKIGRDLHSVPWQLCNRMISIYYRNNMLENLIKLFKGLEAFDRKPPEKSIVQKVADAYEMLGLLEEKGRLLEKYNDLFIETGKGRNKNFRIASSKKTKKSAYMITVFAIWPKNMVFCFGPLDGWNYHTQLNLDLAKGLEGSPAGGSQGKAKNVSASDKIADAVDGKQNKLVCNCNPRVIAKPEGMYQSLLANPIIHA
ncbi:unnamed protein product [Dovyalis caffra]|uniref:Pentatricopeptide repeat-containing protein n=1 Tax=Dovyalis caffra TaxID=77055 RepID=A0AAV1S177_9ROSI|nr:unnamed protein product [Dovyalis caffra]